jgi:hypothetical protein
MESQWNGRRTSWKWPFAGGRSYSGSNDSIPTPVIQKNRLLISGLMFELDARRPTAKVLWPETMAASKRILSNTSNPLLQGDYVYSAKSNGELVCASLAARP